MPAGGRRRRRWPPPWGEARAGSIQDGLRHLITGIGNTVLGENGRGPAAHHRGIDHRRVQQGIKPCGSGTHHPIGHAPAGKALLQPAKKGCYPPKLGGADLLVPAQGARCSQWLSGPPWPVPDQSWCRTSIAIIREIRCGDGRCGEPAGKPAAGTRRSICPGGRNSRRCWRAPR